MHFSPPISAAPASKSSGGRRSPTDAEADRDLRSDLLRLQRSEDLIFSAFSVPDVESFDPYSVPSGTLYGSKVSEDGSDSSHPEDKDEFSEIYWDDRYGCIRGGTILGEDWMLVLFE